MQKLTKEVQIEIRKVLDAIDRCMVCDLTIVPHDINISPEDKEKLERKLKERFKIWSDSWVIPPLKKILGEIE